jgi:nucleoside-diphosphate-sugar epimerase
MKNVLVTGSSGFIGAHLSSKLSKEHKYNIVKMDRSFGDITSPTTWNNIPKCEIVIHLAGKTFVPDSWTDPESFINTNVIGTNLVLNYCRKNNSKLIFLSSYLYGKPKKIPIDEKEPVKTTNPYTLSKKISEDLCDFYSRNYGVDVLILRPFNVYGANQKEHFLIPSIIKQINLKKGIKVKDLKPKRDFIYVKDLVEAIIKTIELKINFEVINIASGTSHSVVEVIEEIQKVKGTNFKVKSTEEIRSDEIMDTKANIKKAKTLLNWVPQWSFEKAIKDIHDSK